MLGGDQHPVPEPCALFPKPAEVMGVLGIMRGVSIGGWVKAFGDKPQLMTRKSVVALMCTAPLARRGKAARATPRRGLICLAICLTFLHFSEGNQKHCSISLVFPFRTPPSTAPTPGLHPILLLVFQGKPERTLGGKSGLLVWPFGGRRSLLVTV